MYGNDNDSPNHGFFQASSSPGLCENNDKFAVDRSLNADPRPGDVAVIHDSGAHGHSMGFNYNGKPRSAEPLGAVENMEKPMAFGSQNQDC